MITDSDYGIEHQVAVFEDAACRYIRTGGLGDVTIAVVDAARRNLIDFIKDIRNRAPIDPQARSLGIAEHVAKIDERVTQLERLHEIQRQQIADLQRRALE